MAKPYMCGDELPVYIPEGGCDCNYTLKQVESLENAFEYQLMLNGSKIGDTITVPYDKYVSNCVLLTVATAEVPYAGAEVGDPYLDITFYNTAEHIYVPLISIVGGGYKMVDTLPQTGDTRYIYLVPDGHDGYNRYVWDASENQWISLGSTTVDLSDYYTKSEIDGMISNIMLRIYPVGSLYISTSSTNPGTVFGGTWTRIQDKFLLAAGSTYSAGSTGGSATVTLTTDNMPSHSHSFHAAFRSRATDYTSSPHLLFSGTNATMSTSTTKGDPVHQVSGMVYEGLMTIEGDTSTVGGGTAHNNMPPYLSVYVWKRTA